MLEVTAAILEYENKILLARRKAGKHLAGYWEFPGGKIEANENAEQCLLRELKEEFSIEVRLDMYIGESIFRYPEKKIKLIAFTGRIIDGELRLNDHDKVVWVDLHELPLYKMAPADIPLIDLYRKKIEI